MNRVIVALHTLDYAAAGLADYGKPGNYFARQIARWSRQYRASETERIEAMEKLSTWLPANIPPGDETALVHGDYRLDNMIFARARAAHAGAGRLGAFHARASARRFLLSRHAVARGERRDPRAAATRSRRARHPDGSGVCRQPTAAAPGARGSSPRVWEFCMAYNLFRIASIRQGIMKRVLEGTAASRHAREAGERARESAELAWRQVEEHLGG